MNNDCPTLQDLNFAIFNGGEEITEEMYQEVLDFFEYIKTKEAGK